MALNRIFISWCLAVVQCFLQYFLFSNLLYGTYTNVRAPALTAVGRKEALSPRRTSFRASGTVLKKPMTKSWCSCSFLFSFLFVFCLPGEPICLQPPLEIIFQITSELFYLNQTCPISLEPDQEPHSDAGLKLCLYVH